MQRLYNSNAFETQYLVQPPLFINTARALLDKTSCLFISSPQEQARLFERHSKLSKLDDRCLLCYSLSRWSHTTSAMLSSRANSWLTWHSVSGLCWIFFFQFLRTWLSDIVQLFSYACHFFCPVSLDFLRTQYTSFLGISLLTQKYYCMPVSFLCLTFDIQLKK